MGWESPYGGVDLTQNVTSLDFKIDSVPEWELGPMCYVNSRDGGARTTFGVMLAVGVAVGVLLLIAGAFFVTPNGTFSFNKSRYQPGTPSG
ncbi:unnamed protein product [Oreochromis niloticus]|nr:unnamed protein product [Mustela putorius furo]